MACTWLNPKHLAGRAKRIIELGISPEQMSAERFRRVRVLAGATFGLSVFAGAPWIIEYATIGHEGLALVVAAAVVAALLNLEVLRRTHRDDRASHAGIAVLASCMFAISAGSGGLVSPNYAWLTLVPLCAAAIIDLRGAAAWTAGILALTAVFWGVESFGGFIDTQVPAALSGSTLAFHRMALIFAVGVLGVSFVNGQRQAERELSVARDKAEREATYRELLMHAAVASSEASSPSEATQESIQRICAAMGWVAGVTYTVDADGHAVYGGQLMAADSGLEPLRGFVENRSYAPGEGPVGSAVSTGAPQLVAVSYDKVPEELARHARAAGVNHAFTVPVQAHGAVRAVLEFALSQQPDDAAQLKDVFALIGSQLGKVYERTQLQEHLRQRQKMEAVGQLAAGVAHEINNPMSYVRSNLHVLRERLDEVRTKTGAPELDDVDELIEESLEGVEHTIRIVRDVRELSHMGSDGSRSVERSVESLAAIADGALRVASAHAPPCVSFTVNHGQAAFSLCSPHQIQQVLVNLLVNAWHAIGDQGNVWLETGTQRDVGFVRVRDDGPGIEAGDQARLFEPFFTTKSVGQGTGLGLSVSYEIVCGHGGELRVLSDLGEGATFEVRLPLVDAEEA